MKRPTPHSITIHVSQLLHRRLKKIIRAFADGPVLIEEERDAIRVSSLSMDRDELRAFRVQVAAEAIGDDPIEIIDHPRRWAGILCRLRRMA